MLYTFMESVGRGEIKNTNVISVTTESRMSSLLTPPKVELKFPLVNFTELVYRRVNHPVLGTRQREVMFTVIHGMYKNRDRLFKPHRVDDPLCTNKACKISVLIQTPEHIDCLCFRVKTAWLWTAMR